MTDTDKKQSLDEAAEEFVNNLAPKIYEGLATAQIHYDDEMICHLLSDGFTAGAEWATRNDPRVLVLVEALEHVVFAGPTKLNNEFCPINQPTFIIPEASKDSNGRTKYPTDSGEIVWHKGEDGAVKLAHMLLDLIKNDSVFSLATTVQKPKKCKEDKVKNESILRK